MAIIINIDVMLAKRKMSVTALAGKVGITMANISVLKNGKVKAIRLSTLEAICRALECQPRDILEYELRFLRFCLCPPTIPDQNDLVIPNCKNRRPDPSLGSVSNKETLHRPNRIAIPRVIGC